MKSIFGMMLQPPSMPIGTDPLEPFLDGKLFSFQINISALEIYNLDSDSKQTVRVFPIYIFIY